MPQLNSDEAANDEPKTYNDEAIGEEDWRGLNTSAKDELADLKGDLVKDDDVEGVQRRRSYDGKGNSHHNDASHRHKDDLDRDRLDDAARLVNFPYPQPDLGVGGLPSVSGISNPLFPNVILPPSSGQVPFNPYRAFHPLLYGAHSPTDMDGKPGMPRGGHPEMPTMYSLPGQLGQIPNPLAPHWSPGPMYPMCTASAMASMLRYPYPFGSYSTTSGAIANVSPFPLVPPHPGGLHPSMLQHRGLPGMPPHLTNGQNGPKPMPEKKDSSERERGGKRREKGEKGTHPYVKKPLNAFMLYMKEQRAKVVAECTLKESAAINQILGRKWHSLNREEQQKYYELARKERQLHMQMFPGWSARDNYGKRKKRKKEKTQDCTAAYYGRIGPNFGSRFCPSLSLPTKRRKKKCVRYQHDDDSDEDSDGSPYQASPEGSYHQPNSVGNHSTPFDSAEHSVLSGGASSNSSNQSGSSLLCDRLSPPQGGLGGEIKRENGTPPNNINNGVDGKNNNNNNKNMFHPSSSQSASSFSSSHSSESSAKRPRKESTKSYSESNSFRPGVNPQQNAGKNNPEPRSKRVHSQSLPSPMHSNLFNPMLSPTSMGLSSPHGNPHPAFFPRMQPYLQIAAAASMPASPLGGLMGFTGLGLSSPMNMGMSGSGATPGVHSGSNPSRHATSALEGKS